jgi:D-alanyl-D-alanine carboxypeptidase
LDDLSLSDRYACSLSHFNIKRLEDLMRRYLRLKIFAATGLATLTVACGGGNQSVVTPTLDAKVRKLMTDQSAIGIGVALISAESIQFGVAGVRKVGTAAVITTNDYFHLGSNSKALTATLAGALIETNSSSSLRWETTLGDTFPELATTMRNEYRTVTLAQLLAHRGGIQPLTEPADLAKLPVLSSNPATARQELTLWLLGQPVARSSSNSTYSNGGYVIAAALMERNTGRPFDELLMQYVFQPLKITPKVGWPAAGLAAQPWGHEASGVSWVANDPDAIQNQFPAVFAPAGNISLSLKDYALFIQSQLRGLRGVTGLIKPQTTQYLHTSNGDYALGWVVRDLDGVKTSAHDGTVGTFYALATLQPSKDKAVVVLTNAYSETLANAVNLFALEVLADK